MIREKERDREVDRDQHDERAGENEYMKREANMSQPLFVNRNQKKLPLLFLCL